MEKRMTVQLDDVLHRHVTDAAGRTERSVHSWILAAVSREVFRQLTAESAAWCAAYPEQADHDVAHYRVRRAHRRPSDAA